jgi:hypothetical protein
VHAHAPHVAIVSSIDDCECVCRKIVAKDIDRGLRKPVSFLAAVVASAAAYAQRTVKEERLPGNRLSVHFFTMDSLRAVEKMSNWHSLSAQLPG